jgi:hypothetical protein
MHTKIPLHESFHSVVENLDFHSSHTSNFLHTAAENLDFHSSHTSNFLHTVAENLDHSAADIMVLIKVSVAADHSSQISFFVPHSSEISFFLLLHSQNNFKVQSIHAPVSFVPPQSHSSHTSTHSSHTSNYCSGS